MLGSNRPILMLPQLPVAQELGTPAPHWSELYESYRVAVLRDQQIVSGRLLQGLRRGDTRVTAALATWPGRAWLADEAEPGQLTLVRTVRPRPRERWWLHLLLALATLATATLSGLWFGGSLPAPPLSVAQWAALAPQGLPFALPLLVVLAAHEWGHYQLARHHGLDVSPPYFLPAPHGISLIGTLGAFIRLRSPVAHRRILLDVAAAGPLASFSLSLPLVAWGLRQSTPMDAGALVDTPRWVVQFGGVPIWLGSSLAWEALAALVAPAGEMVMLHPVALAGWLGLFVTALNLLPLAQLDGGHILYALIGKRQRWAALGMLAGLLVLGNPWWGGWWGWWVWAAMALALGRGRVGHPAVWDAEFPLDRCRRRVSWICVAIFWLCFAPFPYRL